MKKPWVIIFYLLFVVLAYYFVDRSLATYFHQLDLRSTMHSLNILSALGQWMVYLLLFFFAALFFRYIQINSRYEARSWYLFGCVLIANLICFVIKITLGRARPDLLFSSDYFGFYWFKFSSSYWSFPSGHTTTVIALAAGLGVIFPRYFYAVLMVALLVAATRVLLYHHYLSDVMSAFYLSLLAVGFFTQFLQLNNKKRHQSDAFKMGG